VGVVVEDGTGLANANSFNTVADVITYASDRGLDFANSPTDSDAVAACIKAGDYLRNELRFRYNGTRQTATQRMPYPRNGASEVGGLAVPSNTVPWRLKDAHAELTILAYADEDLQPDLDNGGLLVSVDKLDVLETDFFAPTGFQAITRIPGEALRVSVLGYLEPLLIQPGRVAAGAVYVQPSTPTAYQPCEFNNGGGRFP
jgi:hypothetical protein